VLESKYLMIEIVIRSYPGNLFLSSFLIRYWISEGVVCLVGNHIIIKLKDNNILGYNIHRLLLIFNLNVSYKFITM